MKAQKLLLLLIVVVLSSASCSVLKQKKSGEPEKAAQPVAEKSAAAPEKKSAPLPGSIKIEAFLKGKQEIQIKKDGENWTAETGGKTYTVKSKGQGEYELLLDGVEFAKGKTSEDKLKFKSPDKSLYMLLKFKDDKIKVALEEDAKLPWEIKLREDKVKVVVGEKELGKVKYKADTGKIKAKDDTEQTLAESKDIGKLSATLAPFLIKDMDDDRRMFLVLLMFALEK